MLQIQLRVIEQRTFRPESLMKKHVALESSSNFSGISESLNKHIQIWQLFKQQRHLKTALTCTLCAEGWRNSSCPAPGRHLTRGRYRLLSFSWNFSIFQLRKFLISAKFFGGPRLSCKSVNRFVGNSKSTAAGFEIRPKMDPIPERRIRFLPEK